MKSVISFFLAFGVIVQCFSQGSNNCLRFGSGSQFVRADKLLTDFSFDELSVTVWVKPTAANSHGGAIFAFNENEDNFTNNVNLLYFKDDHFEYFDRNLSNYNIPTTGFFPPGNWYHVALVIDQNLNGKVYVNGVERLSFDALEVPVAGDLFSIGQEWDGFGTSGHYQGLIDELRVWNRALSPQEIREDMCRTIAPNTQDLMAYYRFDASMGTLLDDSTPNNNDGELFAFAGNPWELSGAPIGDESVFLYLPDWSNQQVALQTGPGKSLAVNAVANAPEGVHVYVVHELPNSTQGIDFLEVNEYFGVFATNLDANYIINYDFGGYGFECFECFKEAAVFSRNDNAEPSWLGIPASIELINCTATKSNESEIGLSARAEYIVGKQSNSTNISLLPDSLSKCEDEPINLDLSPFNALSYLWSNGATSAAPTFADEGIYSVIATFTGGCQKFDTTEIINLLPPTPFTLQAVDTICLGDSIVLEAPTQPNTLFHWNGGSTAPSYTVKAPETVMLTIFNNCGTATDELTVNFDDCNEVYVPNVFSPNFDGINDVFKIYVEQNRTVLVSSMRVFDRWGEMVFKSEDFSSASLNSGWDGTFRGKPAIGGTYTYVIRYAPPYQKAKILSGEVILLR